MTLVADILATLPELRTEAEGRMVDACTITRGGGDDVFDPETGEYTPAAGTTIYTGPCEVQIGQGMARDSESAGTEVTTERVTVKVPISVEGVREGDVVTITACLLDPDLVDQKFHVVAGHAKTFATARRLQVERITA